MPVAEAEERERVVLPAYAPGASLPNLRGLKRHQLFHMLRAAVHNRVMIAIILTELADRAESDPLLQEILYKIIPPPPLDHLQYVRPYTKYGTHTRGYWRKVPYNLIFPTIPMAEYRLAVSKFAYSLFGTKGVVVRPDGTQISVVAHLTGEKFRGVRYVSEEELEERRRRRAVERMAGEEPPVQERKKEPVLEKEQEQP